MKVKNMFTAQAITGIRGLSTRMGFDLDNISIDGGAPEKGIPWPASIKRKVESSLADVAYGSFKATSAQSQLASNIIGQGFDPSTACHVVYYTDDTRHPEIWIMEPKKRRWRNLGGRIQENTHGATGKPGNRS